MVKRFIIAIVLLGLIGGGLVVLLLVAVVSSVFAANDPVATLHAYLACFQDPSA